ncbi:LamG domain-containing protein, partial [Candidatus Accumulibacter vicinus]|uniref:LamG domain-containing protein n=1 Tax=Candidatus Accumulibacter vicinus TaxID=2954382 RepID=UPI00235B5C60
DDPGGSQGGPRAVPATGSKDADRDKMGTLEGPFIAAVTTSGPMADPLGAMEGALIAGPPPERQVYEGENLTPAEAFTGAPAHERAQLLARLSSVAAEDFEGFTPLQSLAGTVLSRNGVSCTLTGGAATCSDDTAHGRFNTTAAGSKWLDCTASPTDPITLTFSPAIAAFGANMPDFGDFLGQVSVQLTPSGSTADADYRSVVLRLTCDGADNNTTFVDASVYAHTITANGNAKVTTTSPKYGTGALALDGTGDYLSIPYAADLSFNGAEFCIEGWARLDTTVASGLCLIDFRGSGSGSSSWQPFVNASTRSIAIWSGTATVLASASNAVPPMGTWFHWAIERQGTTTKIYIDGAQVSSGTYNPAATNASGIRIGLNQAGTNGWIGAMDDIRFTRKVRYGVAFTPPAAALPIEGDPLIPINHT